MARDPHMNYVRIGSLRVDKALHEFIEQEATPRTSISAEAFWSGFAELLHDYGPRNRQLLQVRDELQSRIDQYHRERFGARAAPVTAWPHVMLTLGGCVLKATLPNVLIRFAKTSRDGTRKNNSGCRWGSSGALCRGRGA